MEVAYLCDKKVCKECNKIASDCMHTTDIKHAINFYDLGADRFIEIPKPTPMDFAISPEKFKEYMAEGDI